jgi:hypothetical protein
MTRHFNVHRGAPIHIHNREKYVEATPRQPAEQDLDRGRIKRKIENRLYRKEIKSIMDDWDNL